MKKFIMTISLICWTSSLFAMDFFGDLMNKNFEGQDLQSSNFDGKICYHSFFKNINLSNSIFKFSTVVRFCNFQGGKAEGTIFDGWFYNQHFEGTSLKGAVFYMRQSTQNDLLPSEASFKGCDLQGAKIYSKDMSRIKFQQTNLSGAQINGKTCEEGSMDICL